MKRQGRGFDYSVESLKDVETLCSGFRLLREEEPARAEAMAGSFRTMAGAYVAEVFRRAVPGAKLSLADGELVVTLPSRLVTRGRCKVAPAVRVGKLMQYEETLHGWTVYVISRRLPSDELPGRVMRLPLLQPR